MLGLIEKFNSPIAANFEFDGVWSLYEGGKLGFVSRTGKSCTVTSESGNHKPAASGKLCTVSIPLTDRHISIK